ncbi:MAG: lamin tail domain-containing protein [Candidatus Omnitrophica bacterium]|nr:lamin tail domain-containing protein [Candidatus Omnitrophota bacterium]
MYKMVLCALLGICLSAFWCPQAEAMVVISEIYYDHPGDDEGHEFVELYNNSDEVVDLTHWEIQWAGNEFAQRGVEISGTIAPHGYFLIGGDFTLADFGVEPDMIYNFDFQNGGSATDGIRLYDGIEYYDTILYDSPNANTLPGDLGWGGATFAPDVTQGHSLAREKVFRDTDEMNDFIELTTPQPDNSSVQKPKGSAQIPENATVISLAGGMAGMNLVHKLWRF